MAAQAAVAAVDEYRHILRRRRGLIALLLALIAGLVLLDFTLGPAGLPLKQLLQTLLQPAAADPETRNWPGDQKFPRHP